LYQPGYCDGIESIVPFEPSRHAAGFRALVAGTLGEFGFTEDPVIDADLVDPLGHYDAVWVVEDGKGVVGSVATRVAGDGEAELKRMYLAPDRRGRGLGRRLLDLALGWARERDLVAVTLDTTAEMTAARALYESVGFEAVGTRTEIGERDSRCEILYRLDLRQS
jgi:ribosomal protein S18 acetylase RimI-like enzyme